MAQRLILARHGDPGSQWAGRFLGATDPPLSALGRQQAAALANRLSGCDFGAAYVSPRLRARQTAEQFGRPVLLTTGSKNLAAYAERARCTGTPLFARVLPEPSSRLACREAGIDGPHTIAQRGPFSIAQNHRHIRDTGAGVLVTKDGGPAGGTAAKLQAAREAACHVVMIRRPPPTAGSLASSGEDVVEALRSLLNAT